MNVQGFKLKMAIEVNRARSMVYLPLIKPEKKDGHRASSMVYIPLLIFASLLISHRLLRTSLQFEVDHSEFDAPCLSMRNATAILKPLQANNSLPPTPDAVIEWLPPCTKSLSFWKDCDPGPGSIDVVLTIFKRPNLRQQLEMLVNSTLQPGNIFVYQSETHQNVPPIVKHFKESFPNFKVPIHIVQAPVDTAGYHGRFFIAYSMSRARYISVWDDDLMVGTRWLERVTKFMASHNDKVIVSRYDNRLCNVFFAAELVSIAFVVVVVVLVEDELWTESLTRETIQNKPMGSCQEGRALWILLYKRTIYGGSCYVIGWDRLYTLTIREKTYS